MRRAIIDIGTNTVKLLVANVHDGVVEPVVSKDRMTRLGEGLDAGGHLSSAAIERTAEAVADYVAEAREHAVTAVRAIATAAARVANNGAEFRQAVRERCGIQVEFVSGEHEAELVFRGVCSDPQWAARPLLVMDVGGGSVEFIQGQAGQVERRQSLPLGAVRLTERFGDDFPGLAQHLREAYRGALRGYSGDGRRMIATGGANVALARIATGRADRAELSFDQVLALVARLNALTLAERRQLPGLPPDRADIIVAGAAALAFAMEALGVYEVSVSTRNLRYGALLEGAEDGPSR